MPPSILRPIPLSSPPGHHAGTAPGIVVANASLDYEGTALFRGLDAVFPGGRWTCLLGPSGVGKSSLLRLIAGLLPVAPQTRVTGDDGQPLQGRIAWMAQQDLLLPWLDVLGNTLLGARLRGQRIDAEARARALAVLERVGLADRAHDRPDRLSGGQRQRVALARTLLEDRPIVLMDEPFSALDTITRWRLQDVFVELLSGRTVVMVTHDPAEALRLAHEVRVMAGTPATLDRPLNPPGEPSRAPDDPRLLQLSIELIRRLGQAQAVPGEAAAE